MPLVVVGVEQGFWMNLYHFLALVVLLIPACLGQSCRWLVRSKAAGPPCAHIHVLSCLQDTLMMRVMPCISVNNCTCKPLSMLA